MTRRVVLTVGGITLLGGVIARPWQQNSAARSGAVRAHLTGSTTSPGNPPHSPPHSPPDTPGHGMRQPSAPASAGPSQPAEVRHPWTGQPMRYVDAGRDAIALTIDDGPSARYTPQVLRLLARYHVTATFSMIGIQVAADPALVREVVAAGHLISNHTWRHQNMAWLSPAAAIAAMDQATEAIHHATGNVPAYYRAPYGVWTATSLRHCQRTGMTPLSWSVDPRDWSRPGVPAIVSNIMRNTRTGSIILEHDGGGDRSETVAALGIVIPRLLDAGYHFVTP
ncbi:MAG: polysaccharide deacetylase family protein [Streptosporangiaceae bacterium]|nr:polysaccharide deacetylase family protein [Streptosporangiaceae bacterium]